MLCCYESHGSGTSIIKRYLSSNETNETNEEKAVKSTQAQQKHKLWSLDMEQYSKRLTLKTQNDYSFVNMSSQQVKFIAGFLKYLI